MKNAPLYILFALITIPQVRACEADADEYNGHIEYVTSFLHLYPERLERALELMPTVEGYSAIHAFDPIVPVVVISCESAWHTDRPGAIGEIGLMQVHGACAHGYDLTVPEQQIQAGIACLAKARDACDGSLRQTLTMYQSGSCKARTARTKRRIGYRMRIIEEWKCTNDSEQH